MRILGIETSCDETSAAVVTVTKDKHVILESLSTASSLSLHAKTAGIIPEIAARQQVKYIIPVISQSLKGAHALSIINGQSSLINTPTIDAIAVTYGPGLIGSLLVGVETAKTLSYVWNKPVIPVNHLIGHIYANFVREISNSAADITFPAIALIVSGGHTDLVLMKKHGSMTWLGGTRDDAAGEAFDKIGRLLGLPYPGGPAIENAAKEGNPKAYHFPRPLWNSDDFDFSFSGLKTAVYREVSKMQKNNNGTMQQFSNQTITNISASVQKAVIDVLVKKTLLAAEKYKVKSLLLGGGVAANSALRDSFQSSIVNNKSSIKLFAPQKSLCTDNAAMIAAAAAFYDKPVHWSKLTANPELYF